MMQIRAMRSARVMEASIGQAATDVKALRRNSANLSRS